MRWVALATCCVFLGPGCAMNTDAAPSPGPGGGPVEVGPSSEPVPGATITLSLSSEDDDNGSACVTLDQWLDAGWRARWYWERSSPVPEIIPDGEERTCPAIGIPLPTEQRITMPDNLADGTWRLAYLAGEDDIGSYVFEAG